MKSKLMLMLALLMFAAGAAQAQIRKLTGKVVDEDGLPVIGALVMVDGTQAGATTNNDGLYIINNVPAGSKLLRISCVGMETRKVAIKDGQTIMLESNSVLNEVMVVAYGTAKKSAFTGSASVVNSDDIAKVQVTNAIDALKGKASGIQINTASGQPGSTPSIRIRGVNSINADSEPLIVLDGSPYDGGLNNINPADVESMTVLKDAASTALYGARGGNGVILITTKSGKKGRNATITVDAKWGSNSRSIPDYDVIKSPAKYYEMWFLGLRNLAANDPKNYPTAEDQYKFAINSLIDDDTYGLKYNVFTTPEGQTLINRDGKFNPAATMGRLINYGGKEYLLRADDWIKETYGTGLRQEYTVNATGSSEKSTFYLSANYLNNEGITVASGYERFTARMKADYQLKPWIKMGANMSYGHYDYDSLGNDGESGSTGNPFSFANMAPIYPMYIRDAQGNIMYDQLAKVNMHDYGDGAVIGLARPYLQQANPLCSNMLDTNQTEGNTFNGTGTIDVTLPFGFTVTSINNIYINESRYTNTVNPFYGQFASQKGQVTKQHDRSWSYNLQQRINWHKTFGKHDVEIMAGHEYYHLFSADLWAYKSNQYSVDNKELDGAVVKGAAGSSLGQYNTESWLGRAMYNYDEKYFISGSVVHEASSRFAKENRWGTFWSVGAGWLINKEGFLSNAEWLNELKLKASYGENGNDLIGNYRYTNTSSITNSNDEVALIPSTKGNPEITWEKNGKFNCGIDFSMFNNRFSGTVEYYNNITKDMLTWFPLAPSYGYTGYHANVGNMRNHGIEIELRGDIVRTKDLNWNIYANITSNSNKITSLPEERRTMHVDGTDYDGYTSGAYIYAEGLSRYTYYTKRYAGVCQQSDIDNTFDEKEKPVFSQSDLGTAMFWKNVYKKDDQGEIVKDAKGNPIVDHQEKTVNYGEASDYICGDMLPDVYGGFGTSVSWKGLDFSMDFQYQLGGQIYDSSYASLMNLGRGHGVHVDMLNAWSLENTSSMIPIARYNDSYMAASSDRFLIDANYLTLSNITLGYTLPANWLRKAQISKLRLYVVADNIWTWSKRQGLDPRMGIAGGTSNQYYKSMRTISGGITVTF